MGFRVGLASGGALLGVLILGVMIGLGLTARLWPATPPGSSLVADGVPNQERDGRLFSRPSTVYAPSESKTGPQTLAEILQIPGDFAQTTALYQLAGNLDEASIQRLLDEAESLRPDSERRAASSILYSKYAELDPAAAANRLLSGGRRFEPMWLARVFQAWAATDFDAAVSRARSLGMQRRVMVGSAILQLSDNISAEDRATLARELGLGAILPQIEAQQKMLRVSDHAQAWSETLDLANRQQQSQQLRMLAGAWAQVDPAAAMAAVENLDRPDLAMQLKSQVIRHWADQDAEAAMEWALAQPISPERAGLVSASLMSLASTDPQRAFALTDGLSGVARQQAMVNVLGVWSRVDPKMALQTATSISNDEMRRRAVVQIAGAYAQMYPNEAAQWLAELGPAEGDQAAVMVVGVLARHDPQLAVDLVAGISDPDHQRNAASRLAGSWARTDPEAAARWASEVDDSELRTQLLGNVLPTWALFDSDAALRFIDGIKDVRSRESAITGVMFSVRDAAVSDELYESLTLPENKRLAAMQLFQTWMHVDPSRSAMYQQAAGISDAQAAQMLRGNPNVPVMGTRSSGLMVNPAGFIRAN
jgi:hypothetical protein